MIIVIDVLKWLGQWPSLKQVLVIFMILFKHNLSLMIYLRWPYKSLSKPGANKLLYFAIALVNSSSENGIHGDNI